MSQFAKVFYTVNKVRHPQHRYGERLKTEKKRPQNFVRAAHMHEGSFMGKEHSGQMILVADIGGTNARFQVYNIDTEESESWTGQTSEYSDFESCLRAMILKVGVHRFDAACFAVAGVVTNNVCQLTNIGWTVDLSLIKSQFHISKLRIINDFEAVGHGISELKEKDLLTLNPGVAQSMGAIAVLGPGTGLGEAILVWSEHTEGYTVLPTEGSHADFAPRGQTQRDLSSWVENELSECEVEHVCSGPGLARIYDFLRARDDPSLPSLTPAEISTRANFNTCKVCEHAVAIFLQILGAEAANLGLKCLATGGVYVAGGIPTKILDAIKKGDLLEAFLRPGSKFHQVRSSFPLHVVLHPEIGLLGSSKIARNLL